MYHNHVVILSGTATNVQTILAKHCESFAFSNATWLLGLVSVSYKECEHAPAISQWHNRTVGYRRVLKLQKSGLFFSVTIIS